MNRYKLICLTPEGEEVFTIEGYTNLEEAQAMLDTLNKTVTTPNLWHLEPVRYN